MIKSRTREIFLKAIGLLFCITPPALAIFLYFPDWISRGDGSAVSGIGLILILMTLSPLFKVAAERLKSPSSYTMWFISFILFFMLSKIADEMTVISFLGFIGNLVGAFFWRAAGRHALNKESKNEG